MKPVEPSGEHESTLCASFQAGIELIGKRWNGAILAVLLEGPRRFSQVVAQVPGLSERLLSQRLRELEQMGIVVRRVLPGPPLGAEYELTEAGRDLAPAVEAVSAWAHKWLVPGPLPVAAADRPRRRAQSPSPAPSLLRRVEDGGV